LTCRHLHILIAMLACTSPLARGSTLEKLLMPGELSAAHADLEATCGKCHDRSDRSRQRQLCLDCHEDVAADVGARQGFHGRAAVSGECNACHGEHKGRDAEIVHFAADAFDHGRTDFPLDGAHVGLACDHCHAAGKRFREARHECVDCHRDADPHRGQLGSDCAQCHSTARFKDVKFDHSRTRFPLQNAHATISCYGCHRDPTFRGAPLACADCHATDDVHHGTRGSACQDCHDTKAWKTSRFDHARATGFALVGRHANVACEGCHRNGDLKTPVSRDCGTCHATADRHSGRFGSACADCHAQDTWKIATYDHSRHDNFVLRGAHSSLDCHACHTARVGQQVLATDCVGCHEADDVHAGSMGRECTSCHSEAGWGEQVRFDHDLAAFPLVGLHVTVACEECHQTRAYRDTPHQCVACHRAKDAHAGGLGEDCGACHNPNGWDFWQFDHGTATHFPLDGAHARLGCADCHVEHASTHKLSMQCESCHRADDVHSGRFGTDCGRCHTPTSFRRTAGP
jgi:Cytochrome c7 and related cytochrome c